MVTDKVTDAADACEDGSLVLSSMDLSYLGVRSIWMNDLGEWVSFTFGLLVEVNVFKDVIRVPA